MKAFWRHGWWIALVLVSLAAVAAFLFWLSQSGIMAIETIEVEGNHAVTDEQVLETATPLLMGESLMRISYDELERSLTAIPYIEAVEVERDFPHTLRIRLRERQPAVVLSAGNGRLFLLSSEGYALAELESVDSGYPVASTVQPCPAEVGEVPDCADVRVAVRFIADIPMNFNQQFSDVAVSDGYIRARTTSGVQVVFGTLDDYGLKFEVLRQLLARSAAQGVLVTIDVSVPERPVTREGVEQPAANADGSAADDSAAADESAAAAAGGDGTQASPGVENG